MLCEGQPGGWGGLLSGSDQKEPVLFVLLTLALIQRDREPFNDGAGAGIHARVCLRS